ncbi:MAG: BON domain-containing protein [Marinobacter sp.]
MPATDMVTSIKAALERDPDINLHRFPVQVSRVSDDNAIRLEGTVEDVVALKKILKLARAEADSTPVIENLHVETSTDMKDDQLRDQVVTTLSSEPLFRDAHITTGTPPEPGAEGDWIAVSTSGSTVHLEGRVHSLSHRRLVEVMTWWVPGSSRVENRLQLSPPEEDSDEELEDAIDLVLERDPSLDVGQIQFAVRDKNVILEGYVTSDVNRRIASRDCWMVPGVHDVDNRIQVQG